MRVPRFPFVRSACGAVLVAMFLAGCGRESAAPSGVDAHDVSFVTNDGTRISATVYPARAPRAPGLILVHMLGASRASFDAFARRAQSQGMASIAFDMRGHGDSTRRGDERLDYRSFDASDWLGVLRDIAKAKEVLLERGADPDNLAIVGASIGANLALRAAAEDPQLQAVVMVSPGLDYHGVRTDDTLSTLDDCPVLLVSAEGDAYSASSTGKLASLAPAFCEVRLYRGTQHGTDLLDATPNASEQIVYWLSQIVHGAEP